jgi:hypothetical protein
VRILDGNHLAATQHRLAETRGDAAAPPPGQALVVFDPALGLVADVFPCEDGHAQERSLLTEVVAGLRQRDLWLADRNFCVRAFLPALAAAGAGFVIRRHEKLAWETAGPAYGRGRIDGSRVREQWVAIRDDEGQRVFLRRVVLALEMPTRDGDTEPALPSDLPPGDADAPAVGRLYRRRWAIEESFAGPALALAGEIDALCYPRRPCSSSAWRWRRPTCWGCSRGRCGRLTGPGRLRGCPATTRGTRSRGRSGA